jgi:hypothetical protein
MGGRAGRYRMACVYVLGIATAIPPAFLLTSLIVPTWSLALLTAVVTAPAVFVLFSHVYCRSAPSLLGVGSEGRSSRYRMAGICLLGGATAIPPALFLMTQIVPDRALVLLAGLIAFPLIFVSLFYVYRRRPLGRAGVGWVLILFFSWYVTLPVFWYYKIYLPSLEAS